MNYARRVVLNIPKENRTEPYNVRSDSHPLLCNQMTLLIERAKKTNPKFKIRRGDIIFLEGETGYRNDGKFIYDGRKVRDLGADSDIDEYGYIPKDFEVLNPNDDYRIPTYWELLIDHNRIIWFNTSPNVEEMKRNLQYVMFSPQNHVIYTWCTLLMPNTTVSSDDTKQSKQSKQSKQTLLIEISLDNVDLDTKLNTDGELEDYFVNDVVEKFFQTCEEDGVVQFDYASVPDDSFEEKRKIGEFSKADYIIYWVYNEE